MIEWDEAKRQANLAKHGVDFAAIEGFDWASAQTQPDHRYDYGEPRRIAYGLIGDRVRCQRRRLISLRKANRREVLTWAGNTG